MTRKIMMQTMVEVIMTEILTEGNYEVAETGIWVQLASTQFYLTRTELAYTVKDEQMNRQIRERVHQVINEIDEFKKKWKEKVKSW